MTKKRLEVPKSTHTDQYKNFLSDKRKQHGDAPPRGMTPSDDPPMARSARPAQPPLSVSSPVDVWIPGRVPQLPPEAPAPTMGGPSVFPGKFKPRRGTRTTTDVPSPAYTAGFRATLDDTPGDAQEQFADIGSISSPDIFDLPPVQFSPQLDEESAGDGDKPAFAAVRSAFAITRMPQGTMVHAVVSSRSGAGNRVLRLRCVGSVALGGYPRDPASDSYLVNGLYSTSLGVLPFSYRLGMAGTGVWVADVPIPPTLVESSLTEQQREELDNIKMRFPADEYDLDFVQMTWAN